MINNDQYQLGTIVTLKKNHPSGTKEWIIVRLGADIKIKSTINNGLYLMFERRDFNKKVNRIIKF